MWQWLLVVGVAYLFFYRQRRAGFSRQHILNLGINVGLAVLAFLAFGLLSDVLGMVVLVGLLWGLRDVNWLGRKQIR